MLKGSKAKFLAFVRSDGVFHFWTILNFEIQVLILEKSLVMPYEYWRISLKMRSDFSERDKLKLSKDQRYREISLLQKFASCIVSFENEKKG